MRFEASGVIAAPPERVWDVYADVERWPEWTESVTSVERLDSGPLTVGSRARIVQPKLPRAVWTVTELEPGRHFVWVSKAPGLTTVGGHYVHPDGEGSRATARLDQTAMLGAVVGRLTRGLTNRYLQMEVQGLKSWCERMP
ncbi:MAG TPA: SRPBCC family protein [Nocardioidaceae bacterium]|nr:SRPBCC family protein [Nocardioidaceae bacterium]